MNTFSRFWRWIKLKNCLKKSPILKNGIIYFIFAIIGKVISFFYFRYLISMLTVSEFGIYSFKPLISFFSFHLPSGGIFSIGFPRFYIDKTQRKEKVLMLSLISFLMFSIVLVLILGGVSLFCGNVIHKYSSFSIIYLFIFWVILENFLGLFSSFFQMDGRSLSSSLIDCSNLMLKFSFVIFFYSLAFKGLKTVVIVEIFSTLLITLVLVCFSLRRLSVERVEIEVSDFKTLKFILQYSYPLIFHKFFKNINNHIDKILITSFLGVYYTGIYAFIYRVGELMLSALSPFQKAWGPYLLKRYSPGLRFDTFKRSAYMYEGALLILSSIFIFLYPFVVKILDREGKFFAYYNLIPFAVFSMIPIVGYQIFAGGIIASYRSKTMMLISAFAGGLNVLLNLILIPLFKIYGALMATFLSNLLYFLVSTYYSNKFLPICDKKPLYFFGLIMVATAIFAWIRG